MSDVESSELIGEPARPAAELAKACRELLLHLQRERNIFDFQATQDGQTVYQALEAELDVQATAQRQSLRMALVGYKSHKPEATWDELIATAREAADIAGLKRRALRI